MTATPDVDQQQVLETIKQQVSEHPVVLYMKGTPEFPQCGFSSQVVQALNICEAKFASVNVLERPDIRATLPLYANWPTFPQLYIKGELVGGCDIVVSLYQSGELQKMLEAA